MANPNPSIAPSIDPRIFELGCIKFEIRVTKVSQRGATPTMYRCSVYHMDGSPECVAAERETLDDAVISAIEFYIRYYSAGHRKGKVHPGNLLRFKRTTDSPLDITEDDFSY